MGDTPNTQAWPGEDQAAIALAARVVMLSAAGKTCHLRSTTKDQDDLLRLLALATDTRQVGGESFPEFLGSAKDVLRKSAGDFRLAVTLRETLDDIAACRAVDVISELFDHLVRLASQEYERPLDPTLSRETLLGKPGDRPTAVRGKVRRRGNEVGLVLYAERFDLTSLALVPRILAHEIVCHIAARDTGRWNDRPEPDVRDYFPDGFMDRAAWRLLIGWHHAGALPEITPVGHLSVADLEYSCDKPEAFQAGIAAFENCVTRTAQQVQAPSGCAAEHHDYIVRSQSEKASIDAALRLNACCEDICHKDWFVHHARGDAVAGRFASVAAGGAEPSELFEHVASR
jgi:hypothetical protein